MSLRLNRYLVPGLEKVSRELEALRAKQDAAPDPAFVIRAKPRGSWQCVVRTQTGRRSHSVAPPCLSIGVLLRFVDVGVWILLWK